MLVTALSLTAWAGEAPLVLLVGPAGDPLHTRLVGELELMGYRTESLGRSADWLAAARERSAVGVVEVDPQRDEVVLWTVGRERSELASRYRVGSTDPQTLAIKAVELLHGRLVPVASQTNPDLPREGQTRPTPRTREEEGPIPKEREQERELRMGAFPTLASVFLGPGLTWAAGGASPFVGPRLAIGWSPNPSIEVGVTSVLPPTRSRVALEQGEANVDLFAAGVTARRGWRVHAFTLDAGLALLAQHGKATTRADPTAFAGAKTERWSLRPEVVAGATWRVADWFGLRATGSVGGLAPPIRVRDVDNPSEQQEPEVVARLASPILAALLGVEFGLRRWKRTASAPTPTTRGSDSAPTRFLQRTTGSGGDPPRLVSAEPSNLERNLGGLTAPRSTPQSLALSPCEGVTNGVDIHRKAPFGGSPCAHPPTRFLPSCSP